jgi:PfaD family protein
LAKAGQADMASGPAADMFEMGARVQVLKFGTLYAMRAQKLAELYRQYSSLEDIPPTERENLEAQVFKAPLAEIWAQTRRFFQDREPAQMERAEKDPKHKMALVFRWYLGQASRWAIAGAEDRRADWQILCGPAQGAFNEWARGSVYEKAENRRVLDLALNLFHGAAVLVRRQMAQTLGVLPPGPAPELRPRPVHELAGLDAFQAA